MALSPVAILANGGPKLTVRREKRGAKKEAYMHVVDRRDLVSEAGYTKKEILSCAGSRASSSCGHHSIDSKF